MESVTEFVEKRLKLKVNREKSAVDRPWKRNIREKRVSLA